MVYRESASRLTGGHSFEGQAIMGLRSERVVLLRALAQCRGLLYEVRTGTVDVAEVERILEITSLRQLATELGISEDELAGDE